MRRLKGSIQKLGPSRWRVFATVKDERGVSRRVSKTVEGSRSDAERELERLSGQDGTRADRPFGEVLDLYLEHCASRVKANTMARSTLDGYRAKVEHCLRGEFGRTKCSELSVARLNRFIDSLERDRRGTFAVLRIALNWAYRNGYISTELSRRMETVPQRSPSVGPDEVYSAEECAALLNHPMPDGLKTAVVLALSCGLRRGEICGLLWDDYDGERIEIRRAWGKDVPKTEASAAALIVPDWAREWLDQRRGEGHVVTNADGTPMGPDVLTRAWSRLWLHQSGKPRDDAPPVKRLPFKNLRHTSLTLVYESTGDIKAASKRGRHTTSYITERFYVRPSRSSDQKAADALDDVFGEGFKVSH